MPIAIGTLALLVRVWAPGPVTQTQDEFVWLLRSNAFRHAVVDGHLDRATAGVTGPKATMPGVTTMWAGTLGYASVSVAHAVGLASNAPGEFTPPVLRASRAFVAIWCSIALALFVAIAWLLLGRRVATIAGVILATEPFLVGHSDVLHTDAMVTMFGALSVIALAASLWGSRTGEPLDLTEPVEPSSVTGAATRIDRRLLAVSAVSGGLAMLTKLNAVPLVAGGAAVVVGLDLLLRAQSAGERGAAWRRFELRRTARLTAIWLAIALVVFVALWPALWVSPLHQITLMRESLGNVGKGYATFFRHRVTRHAGPTYYPVAMLFRMTPWFLVAAALSVPGAAVVLVRSVLRSRTISMRAAVLAMLLLAAVPYAIVISLSAQKYDRYALPLFPFLALLVGVGIVAVLRRVDGWVPTKRWVGAAGAVLTLLLAITTLARAPYAISYADPLVGGQARARKNILLGWGEGFEVLGAEVRHREGDHCRDTSVFGAPYYVVAFPCARLVTLADLGGDVRNADYYVRYIGDEQRANKRGLAFYSALPSIARLVKAVRIDGVTYAELWKINDRA